MSPKLTQIIEQSAALSPQEKLELATYLKSSQNSPDRWDLSAAAIAKRNVEMRQVLAEWRETGDEIEQTETWEELKGRCWIDGQVGRNVGAGMTGGLGYFLDEDDTFIAKINPEIVKWQRVQTAAGEQQLKDLIAAHGAKMGSQKAQEILSRWAEYLPKFWQLVPPDIIDLVDRVIENTQQRIPALERSIQEIRQEWKLNNVGRTIQLRQRSSHPQGTS